LEIGLGVFVEHTIEEAKDFIPKILIEIDRKLGLWSKIIAERETNLILVKKGI
jgi:prefoldin subunit 5